MFIYMYVYIHSYICIDFSDERETNDGRESLTLLKIKPATRACGLTRNPMVTS